jgi:5'-methylthioadenosine phosphorylase
MGKGKYTLPPPYDKILVARLARVPMAVLPRHGRGHVHSASNEPYRANREALKRLGIGGSDCGSLRGVRGAC